MSGREIVCILFLVGTGIPFQSVSIVYRAVSEAHLNFKQVSIVRLILGMLNYLGPVLVSNSTTSLVYLVAVVVLSRVLGLLLYRRTAMKYLKSHETATLYPFDLTLALDLWRHGKWISVTGIISPIISYSDRFFVGYILGPSAVTVFILPLEVASQLLLISGAVTSIAFPYLSRSSLIDARAVFERWTIRLTLAMALLCSLLYLSFPYLLRVWLGGAASPESTSIGQILCVGVFLNAIAGMYLAQLHAVRQFKMTAQIHALELLPHLIVSYSLISWLGVVGAAYAWTIRILFDLLLMWAALRYLRARVVRN